jgi:hypothetical protein
MLQGYLRTLHDEESQTSSTKHDRNSIDGAISEMPKQIRGL